MTGIFSNLAALLILAMMIFTVPVHAAWYNPNWPHRIKLTIDANKVNGDLANFPIYVNLNDLNGTNFFTNVQTGGDIRVTKSDGITEVARELVYLDKTTNAGELHFIANGTLSGSSNSDWYMYYGNSSASEPGASNTYGAENVWTNNYAGVWHMNENPVQDGARQFTATNLERLSTGDTADLSTGNIDFSVAGWVYYDSTTGTKDLVGKGQYTGSGREWRVHLAGNQLQLYVSGDGQNTITVIASSFGNLSTSQWYFFTAWHDASSDTMNIQINDGTVDSAATSGTAPSDRAGDFFIGEEDPGYAQYHDGRASKIGFWKRILTSSERTWLYNKGSGRFYNELGQSGTNGSNLQTNLISYWNLNEASGAAIDSHGSNNLSDTNTVTSANGPKDDIVSDSSGNNNHGSFSGYSASEILNARKIDTAYNNFNTVFIDSSSNNFHALALGFNSNGSEGRSTDIVSGANGKSLNLPGDVNHYLSLNKSTFHDRSNLSISFWIKSSDSGQQAILSGANSGDDNEILVFFNNNTTLRISDGAGAVHDFTVSDINDGNWHHFTVLRNQSLGEIRVYQNASESATGAISVAMSNLSIDNGGSFIGQEQDSVGGGFDANQTLNGNIDELRIYNDILSTDEITYLYNSFRGLSGGTNPYNGNLHFHLGFDEANTSSLLDLGAGNSLELDGTDDQISIPNLGLSGNDTVSFSAWVKINSNATYDTVIKIGNHGSALQAASITLSGSGGFGLSFAGSNDAFSNDNIINTGEWVHLAGVKTPGAINTSSTLYLNGVAVPLKAGASTGTPNIVENASNYIGSFSGAGNRIDGLLDDVRVYDDALTAEEILYIYTEGAAGTDPNTSNLVGHWAFDDNSTRIKDSSSNRNHGTPNGGMGSSNSVNGQTGKALDFDGSTQDLTIPDSASLDITDNLSASIWFNPDSFSGTTNLFDKGDHDENKAFGSYWLSNSVNFRVNATGTVTSQSTTNPTTGNWHYLVETYNSTDGSKLYLNSTLEDSDAANGAIKVGTSPFVIANGYNRSNYFNGKIGEVRISNITRSTEWSNTEYNNQNSSSTFYSSTQQSSPSITSLSPADNSQNIAIDSNLTISFDRSIDIQSGNLYIRKISDHSIIETIDLNSAAVTGNGSTSISINPSVNFSKSTDLYINIDNNALQDNNGTPFFGINNKTTWNFTTIGLWDRGAWSKRIPITIQASQINGDLSNFPIYINLGDLPDSFFDDVATNGADLRITKNDGTTHVAREVVYLDKTANAGELHFVANGTLSSTDDTIFYLYYGNSSASEPAANSSYGSQNVWNSYLGVWHMNENPNGDPANAVKDSTSGANHGTPGGSMTSADLVAGKLGNSIDFDATDDRIDTGSELVGTGARTLTAWINPTGYGENSYGRIVDNNKFLLALYSTNQRLEFSSDGSTVPVSANSSISLSQWQHVAATRNISGTANLYIDGSLNGTTNQASGTPAAGLNNLLIGNRADTARTFDGRLDEIRISTVVRSQDWISTEYNNQNSPSSFYNNGAIQSSPIASNWYSEAWAKRSKLTINAAQVNGDLSNFPIYVNLADLNGEEFFSNVDSNGADIRVTKSDGLTEVAREIVSTDVINNGGEMHFVANGTLSGSTNTIFYIYYGNPSAVNPAANSQYGSENVWTNNYVGVWHLNEGKAGVGNAAFYQDSTANNFDGDDEISDTGQSGQLGNGNNLDGSDYIKVAHSASLTPNNISFSTWFKTNNKNSTQKIISKTESGGYQFSLNENSACPANTLCSLVNVGGSYYAASYAIANLSNGQWYHSSGTYNGETVSLYLDGALINADTSPSGNINYTSNTPTCLGAESGAPSACSGGFHNGSMDEVRISNIARTAQWINTEYNNQNSPSIFYTVGDQSSGLFNWNLF